MAKNKNKSDRPSEFDKFKNESIPESAIKDGGYITGNPQSEDAEPETVMIAQPEGESIHDNPDTPSNGPDTTQWMPPPNVREEVLARVAAIAKNRAMGAEIPKLNAKEGTPEVVKEAHLLLVELQAAGFLPPYATHMAYRMNELILKVESEYGVVEKTTETKEQA